MTSTSLEREKLDAEKGFRERELLIRERDQTLREAELDLKKRESASSGWRNPLVVAIAHVLPFLDHVLLNYAARRT